MSKIISNPTSEDLKILCAGKEYSVEAKSETIVPDEVASFWLTLHAFLEVSDTKSKADIKELDEIITEPTVEVEEVVEKVTKKTKK